VFPTCSRASPTQMIVALAVRLADNLKGHTGAHRSDGVTLGWIERPGRPRLAVSCQAVSPF